MPLQGPEGHAARKDWKVTGQPMGHNEASISGCLREVDSNLGICNSLHDVIDVITNNTLCIIKSFTAIKEHV